MTTLTINIDNYLSYFDFLPDYLQEVISNALTWFDDEGVPYEYFDKDNWTFYTGFIPVIVGLLKDRGFCAIAFNDLRKTPETKRQKPNLCYTPYAHQESVFGKLNEDGYCRGIINASVASGKTFVMAMLLSSFVKQPRTLVIVNQKDLLVSHRKELAKYLDIDPSEIGLIGNGRKDTNKNITIAMVQTLNRNIQKYKNFIKKQQCLLVDEVHRASAQSYRVVFHHTDNCFYRYGFSATPEIGVGHRDAYIRGIFGEILIEITTKSLMEAGVLPETNVYMYEFNHRHPKFVYDDVTYPAWFSEHIVNNTDRNQWLADFASWGIAQDYPTVVLVKRIAHGKLIQKLIPGSVFMSGADTMKKRSLYKKQLASGEISCLVTNLFKEGVDIPCIKCAVITGGVSGSKADKSNYSIIQEIGRALRTKPEKYENTVDIYQIFDRNIAIFEKQASAALATYKQLGLNVSIVR